jgi:hypothetical protein
MIVADVGAGNGFMTLAGALEGYRALLQGTYRFFGRTPNSAFTLPEAFEEMLQ